ncbi:hypothetical protein IEQ34_005137 [Dendrobium chrysotoxum]|uniref:Uncharacterized protein n=1 Tax=Dendrobium chrysotoxum TaxID=161865 RepID=A0AAV7HBF9_DENCH|nr:hypothetical protein IEQ34_005137 [Dendrobium chrysotoxum]
MNLKRALTPFLRGFVELYYGDLRCKSSYWCEFERYGFSETSKDVSEFSSRFGGRTNDLIKFATKNVCPAVVYVSHEKGIGGSGIIIDSDGTVLTRACTGFSLDSRSKIIISPHDGIEFLETFLESNEDHDLTLLKGNLRLSDEELMSKIDIYNFHLGRCGGPIVTLDGDVVGICTQINMIWPHANGDYYGTINAMDIEEALSKVGYRKKW